MDYTSIIAGLVVVGVLIYYYLTRNYGYWEKAGVPYLKDSLPGLGNVYPMFFMRKNLTDMHREFYERMPGCSIVGFYNIRSPAILVRDPELVKSILQTNFQNFNKNGLSLNPEVDLLLSGNPFFLHGEKWRKSRHQLTSAFTSGKLKYMYKSIDDACGKLVRYLDERIETGNGETELEMKNLFSRYTAEVVASEAFGIEGNSFNEKECGTLIEIVKILFERTLATEIREIATMLVPLLSKIFNISLMPPKMTKSLTNLVKDVIKYRADHNVERNDFLQLLINLKKSGATDHRFGGQFNDETIAVHATTFLIDGYETSSTVLSFVGYQLAMNPEVQQRLRDEVLSVIEAHNGITYEALQEMAYLERVIYESMRLYPAVGSLFKICTKETELKGSDGITCQVTPGMPVTIPISGLHRDPEYWPDPEKFDPDRFTEENKRTRHRFSFIPFGEGPRICIGMQMALLQVKAAVATTVERYVIELSPKTHLPLKLDPNQFLTAVKGGIWTKLKAV